MREQKINIHINNRHKSFSGVSLVSENSSTGRLSPKAARIFVGAFLIAGIVLIAVTALSWQSWTRFNEDGVSAQAQVVDTDRRMRPGNQRDDFFVTYRYTVDGQEYEQRQKVGSSTYYTLSGGDTIDIMYLASNPAQAQIGGDNSPILPVALTIASVAVNVGVLVAAWWFFLRGRGQGNTPTNVMSEASAD